MLSGYSIQERRNMSEPTIITVNQQRPDGKSVWLLTLEPPEPMTIEVDGPCIIALIARAFAPLGYKITFDLKIKPTKET